MLKDYPVEGEQVIYMSDAAMLAEVSKWYKPKWMARFIGGYCTPSNKMIHIKLSRRKDMKLLNHERGHLQGYKHTWMPSIMFPSWIGRLVNSYFPPYGGKNGR